MASEVADVAPELPEAAEAAEAVVEAVVSLPPLRQLTSSASGQAGMKSLSAGNGRKWKPAKPWDSSSSRLERTTAVYDAASDKYISAGFRAGIRRTLNATSNTKSHAVERDQHRLVEQAYLAAERVERDGQLAGLTTEQPLMYKRTWDLWPTQERYYPSTLSAGGSDLCPIRRRMVVVPPKDHVPCESLSTTGFSAADFQSRRGRFTPYASVDGRSQMGASTFAEPFSPAATTGAATSRSLNFSEDAESEWGRSSLSRFSSLSGLSAGAFAQTRRRTVVVPAAMS
ncbi:hypothetical protein NFJ02_17g27400 [Pycnococcus provasolii]